MYSKSHVFVMCKTTHWYRLTFSRLRGTNTPWGTHVSFQWRNVSIQLCRVSRPSDVHEVHIKFSRSQCNRFTWIYSRRSSLGALIQFCSVFGGIPEPKRSEISFEGFRVLFDAAKQAGIYLMARPGERCSRVDAVVALLYLTFPSNKGPYINTETTAGVFPG